MASFIVSELPHINISHDVGGGLEVGTITTLLATVLNLLEALADAPHLSA